MEPVNSKQEHILYQLARRYPQLLLPIAYGIKDSAVYRDTVLRGRETGAKPNFHFSEKDWLKVFDTPVGKAEAVFLSDREDFEHCFLALANHCEPKLIPAYVGASTLIGLVNWEKIREHKKEYGSTGGMLWNLEFRRFTSNKNNYCDTIILLSDGAYSGISPELSGYPAELWREKSLTIRTYHELTHFLCRSLFPGNISVLRDEVLADMVGIQAAFGHYDAELAARFLGVVNGRYLGGRIAYYVAEEEIANAVYSVSKLIENLKKVEKSIAGCSKDNILEKLAESVEFHRFMSIR